MAESIDLEEIHDTLVSLAFEAGRLILAANPSDISTGTKLNSADIVTETDKAVEHMISTRLRARYPSYVFIGEETFVPGDEATALGDAPTFVVDPIDGTTNFVHGFPDACVSLGFVLGRRPAVGVVYNPFQDLLFTGVRGGGSYAQRGASLPEGKGRGERRRLPLAGVDVDVDDVPGKEKRRGRTGQPLGDLSTALVAVEWGSQRSGPNFEGKARAFRALTARREDGGAMVHSLRSLGSAALNLCACAAGQVDLYWEGGCWAWDVAAGWCILEEAGGRMVSGNPDEWDPAVDSRVYLAVRGASAGQKEIVEEFWRVVADADARQAYEH